LQEEIALVEQHKRKTKRKLHLHQI